MPTTEVIPMNEISIGIKIVSTCLALYEDGKQASFQDHVETALKQLETGIKAIEADISGLEKKLAFWRKLDVDGDPMTVPLLQWDNRTIADEHDVHEVAEALGNIYTIICKQDLITAFLDQLTTTGPTSKAERAFRYWTNYILRRILLGMRCFTYWVEHGNSEAATEAKQAWSELYDLLITKGHLEAMAKSCSRQVDEFGPSVWVSSSLAEPGTSSFSSSHMLSNVAVDLPEGHVVSGWTWVEDSGVVSIVIWHGLPGNDGFLTNVGCLTPSPNPRNEGKCVGYYLYTRALTVPSGHYITNIVLSFEEIEGGWQVVWPQVEYARALPGGGLGPTQRLPAPNTAYRYGNNGIVFIDGGFALITTKSSFVTIGEAQESGAKSSLKEAWNTPIDGVQGLCSSSPDGSSPAFINLAYSSFSPVPRTWY